jgi:hypothetical protein
VLTVRGSQGLEAQMEKPIGPGRVRWWKSSSGPRGRWLMYFSSPWLL